MAATHAVIRPIVGGVLASALVLGSSPQPAFAAAGAISVPIPDVPAAIEIQAVSGNSVLAIIGDDYRLSSNAGATWTTAKLPLQSCDDCSFGVGRVESGIVPLVREAAKTTIGWYSLTGNKAVGATVEVDEDVRMAGDYVAVTDGDRYKVLKSDGTSWSLDAQPDGIFADGSVLVQESGRLDRVTSSGARSTLVSSFGEDEDNYAISGNLLAYAHGLQLCVRSVSAAAHCAALHDGSTDIALVTSAGVLVGYDDAQYWYPLASGVLQAGAKLALSDGVYYSAANSQEDQTPLLSAADPTGSRLLRVKANGSLQQVASVAATVQAQSKGIALTPTTLVGVRSAGGSTDRTWARSVGSTIGSERALFDSSASGVSSGGRWATASAVASAGRWAAYTTNGVVRLYDGDGARSASLTAPKNATLTAMSGSHLLASVDGEDETTYQVWNPAGGWQKDDKALDLFGSLVLDSTAKSNVVTVRDTAGGAASLTVTLPGGAGDCYTGYRIWGDWVAADHYVPDPDESDGCDGGAIDKVVAKNFRTGASTSHAGSLLRLGDGVAVIAGIDVVAYSAWNLKTGANTQLNGTFDWNAGFAIDGGRVAYNTMTDLVIRTIDGVAASAPRNLGVVADSAFNPTRASWTVDLDVTKPLRAGTLEIRNAAGAVVRNVAVPASANGSLRGIAWDGKDAAGKAVPSGTYSYKLMSVAVDGSGAARAVDGTDRYLGKVTVADALVPATPVLSGAAVFGKKLTVKAGAWKPSKVKLSYRWLRDGQPISKATKSSYKLGAKDVGRSVSVRVTGKKSHYSTVSVTSAAVTVLAATFSKAYTPSISGKTTVGKTVKAKVKSWSPKAKFSYQWLRDGQPIAKATKSTYKLGALDAGRTIAVEITGRRTGYATVVRRSATISIA